jgi:ubiquinol-cytochrome c reductase cytochrome b subunit
MGALLMGLSVAAFFFVPWLDRSPVRSIRYKPFISKLMLTVFAISFVSLGYLGLQPAEGRYVMLARIFSVLYFLFFIGMPFYSRWGTPKPVPERVVYHAH